MIYEDLYIIEESRENFTNKRFIDDFMAPEKVKYIVDNIKIKSNIIQQNVFSLGIIILENIKFLKIKNIIGWNRKSEKY